MKNLLVCIFLFVLSNCIAQTKDSTNHKIAILDFEMQGTQKEVAVYNWMSFSFAESINEALSKVPQLTVAERTNFNKLIKEQQLLQTNKTDTSSIEKAGKLVGVKNILSGSCQIVGGYLLANIRMIDIESEETTLINTLPMIKPIDSALYLQRDICLQVLRYFKIKSQAQELADINTVTGNSTKSIKAYELLNKGIELYRNEQYTEAIDMYNAAINLDKKYGKAYYQKALCNMALKQYEAAGNDFNNAPNYIKKDSSIVLASNAYHLDGLDKRALDGLKKAEKLYPKSESIKKAIKKYDNIKVVDQKKANINTKYETVYEFNNGRAKVSFNHKYGFIDSTKNVVIPVMFDQILDFKKGLAAARIGTKWGFIDEKGKFVIEPTYSEVSSFDKHGLAMAVLKNKWGVINKTGQTVIPIQFNHNDWYTSWQSEELIKVSQYDEKSTTDEVFGVFDIDGNPVLPIIYDDIKLNYTYNPSNGNKVFSDYIKVSLNKKWGVVNRYNQIIIPIKYDSEFSVGEFINGYAAVKVKGKWGFVNKKGVEVIEPIYERVTDYNNHYFQVKLRDNWGLIDTNNTVILPIIYDNLRFVKRDYFIAKKANYWGIIDLKNNIVCDFIYDNLIPDDEASYKLFFDKNFDKQTVLKLKAKKDGKTFWINEYCQCIFGCD